MLNSQKILRGLLLPLGVTTLFWLFLLTIGLSWVGGLPPAPTGGIGNPFYYLVKGSILWVPLGFVFAVAGHAVTLQRWLVSGVATFLLVSVLTGVALGLWDYMEAVFALIGSWTGLWIGQRMRVAPPEPKPSAVNRAGVSLAEVPPETNASTKPLDPNEGRRSGAGMHRLRTKGWNPENSASYRDPASTGMMEAKVSGWRMTIQTGHFWLRLPLLLLILGLTGWAVWSFSRWQSALGAGLLVYLIVLLRFRHAWLFALPALLPTLNLVPWSGRISLDELDLVMLITLAGAVYHGVHPGNRQLAPRPIALLLWSYALVCVAAFFIGLLPLPDLDLNAFDNYFSRFNSWTIGKGFLWGFLFLGLVRWTLPGESRLMVRLFVPGLLTGLFIVALVGLRERWQYADLLDFSVPYRITSSFSSMHTGGAHLDAYLALLVPFIGYWMVRNGRPWVWAAGLGLFSLAVYLVISTVTRTTVVVLIIEMLLLSLFLLKRLFRFKRSGLSNLFAGLLITAIAGPLLYLGTAGNFFQQRLDLVERDADIRMIHWAKALEMMDRGLFKQTLGMGFGRFPATYLERNESGATPGTYDFQQLGNNTYLSLYPGKSLYLAQKVSITDNQIYRLALDVKSQYRNVTVSAPLCEKHLLNSKRCHWMSHSFDGGDDRWHRWEVEISSGELGEGNWLSQSPTELFLYNPNKEAAIELDNVSLRDAQGNELLNNGSFDSGGDYWFFKTHEHLPWHIKNLWVAALFEQGWLGVTIISFLLLGLLLYLFGPAWYAGHSAAAAVVVAIVGFSATGLFASPFDAPRITLLFFIIVTFGLYETAADA